MPNPEEMNNPETYGYDATAYLDAATQSADAYKTTELKDALTGAPLSKNIDPGCSVCDTPGKALAHLCNAIPMSATEPTPLSHGVSVTFKEVFGFAPGTKWKITVPKQEEASAGSSGRWSLVSAVTEKVACSMSP